jgi:hypothetical protein
LITRVKTASPTRILRMKYHLYHEFATCGVRTIQNTLLKLKENLPYFYETSKVAKMNILGMFEEFHLKSSVILEKENSLPNYIYIVIKGQLNLHKKIKVVTH